jgi:hypothetical protein
LSLTGKEAAAAATSAFTASQIARPDLVKRRSHDAAIRWASAGAKLNNSDSIVGTGAWPRGPVRNSPAS